MLPSMVLVQANWVTTSIYAILTDICVCLFYQP